LCIFNSFEHDKVYINITATLGQSSQDKNAQMIKLYAKKDGPLVVVPSSKFSTVRSM